MTSDSRGRRAARPGLILRRAARRPMRSFPAGYSLMSLSASVCLLLSEWISFLLVAVPSRSRRTFVELLIGCMLNPGRLGHPRHRRDLPRGALEHLLQTDRAGACLGHRSVLRLLQLVQWIFPAELVNLDHRRYPGATHGDVGAGHQRQARSCQEGQSTDLPEQPVLGNAGLGGAGTLRVGADGADSLLAGRGIGPARQVVGGATVDRLGPEGTSRTRVC